MSTSATATIHSRARLLDGSVGTIQYIGEVTGHKGMWLGIEWDDVTRGKHNGTINGRTYFRTRHATAGSMVRPEKIMSTRTVYEEIESKYILSENGETDQALLAETQKKMHASIFEIVGMDKIKQRQSEWSDFSEISLIDCNASSAGQLALLTQLSMLDLTASLISSWSVLGEVCRQIPTLNHLNISDNRIQLPKDDEIEELRQHFSNLKVLNMRNCDFIDWKDVLNVARLWPNIESLALQGNGLSKLTPPDTNEVFKSLQKLDLQQNNLSDFNEILALGHIATLQQLLLMENAIKCLEFPEIPPNERLSIFHGLIELNLKGNSFEDECATFNELDKLPAFTNLFYTVNPTIGYESVFSNCVSRISQLLWINSTPVTSSCRRGAEYDVWKALGQEWTNATDAERLTLAIRCRAYPRLIEKYGSPAELCMVATKVSNLFTIQIRMAGENATKPITKRVSRKMSAQALLGVVMKLFGTASTTMPALSYVNSSRSHVKIPMDNLTKSLDFYSMQDGDVVFVEWPEH